MAEQNEICLKCDDLLPAAERTALLFQMSYLYLAGYPELERMIRERALNTRLLFVSTQTVMFKCVCTSDNLVRTLFPIIKVAIERNKPEMAKTYLAKAEGWVDDIIKAAEVMVEKYEKENRTLSETTSSICAKKDEKKEKNSKIKQAEQELKNLEDKLKTITEAQISKQKEIDDAKSKYHQKIDDMTRENKGVADKISTMYFFKARLYVQTLETSQGSENAMLSSLEKLLNTHMSEMADLKKAEDNMENTIMKKRMELMRLQLQEGTLPSPENLEKVKESLCKIQTVLLEILTFWKFVHELLKKMEANTFAGNDLMEELEGFKDKFIEGITNAEKDWAEFGKCCKRAQQMFEVQNKDAFKFLETSLTAAEWDKQRAGLEERLCQICQTPGSASTE